MSEKKTCAWCKKKFPIDTMVVKNAGKQNTYWCCEEHRNLTTECKKKREENKKKLENKEMR